MKEKVMYQFTRELECKCGEKISVTKKIEFADRTCVSAQREEKAVIEEFNDKLEWHKCK